MYIMYIITITMTNEHTSDKATDWHQLPDEECIALAQQGNNDDAFSELVRRYQQRIYRYILRITNNPDDALDLTQDTFVKVFLHLNTWQPQALFRTWLFRIATNATTDYLRRNKLWSYVPFDESNHMRDNESNIEKQLDSAALYKEMIVLIQKLPLLFREALLLREMEGMSYTEIAQALDINEGTVKSRISRARQSLASGLASPTTENKQ